MAKVTKTTSAAPSNDDVKQSKTGILTIPGVRTEKLTTLIIGTAPLIINRFSSKARQMILDKHTGKASAGRERKDPVANFEGAQHRLLDGSHGYSAGGLKAALVEACDVKSGLAKSKAKAIRISADCQATNLVRIIGPREDQMGEPRHDYEHDGAAWPRLREDMVRNATGVADVRHRPEYFPWAMLIQVEWPAKMASAQQILQAVAESGFGVGLGEWRPKSKMSLSGSFGTFRLASEAEVEAYERGDLFGSTDAVGSFKAAAE